MMARRLHRPARLAPSEPELRARWLTTRRALFFFFQAEDGIRDVAVTGVQTCALPICATLFAPKSCHGPQAYMGAKSVAPLKVPAGLDAPETSSALRIPALTEPAPPAQIGRASCRERV